MHAAFFKAPQLQKRSAFSARTVANMLFTRFGFITKSPCSLTCLLLVFSTLPSSIFALSKQLPIDSINYVSHLSKAEFDKTFPGKVLKDASEPQEPGWYLLYKHENLSYFFGPEPSEAITEFYQEDLQKTLDKVTAKRASLKSATLELVKLPREQASSNTRQNNASQASQNSQSDPENTTSPSTPPTPPTPPSLWQKVLNLFGF